MATPKHAPRSAYPLSSCACYMGDAPPPVLNQGIPTNMSVGNCMLAQPGLKNRPTFKSQVEPKNTGPESNIALPPYACTAQSTSDGAYNPLAGQNPKGYTYYNHLSSQDYSPGFYKVDCPNSSRCPEVYFAQDARLFDPRRNSLMKLNRPPFSSNFFTTNNDDIPADFFSIYQPEFNEYGAKVYQGYGDIKTGDILYYINHEIQDAYHQPNFTIPAQVEGVLYKDPMGALKPTYVRTLVQKPDEKYNRLSWIRDSAFFREDIMAGQSAQRNQQRWGPRWSSLKTGA